MGGIETDADTRGRETDLAKRCDDESDLVRAFVGMGVGRSESTVVDEKGVDDGVKKVVVDGVVDVRVLVVVAPSNT